MRTRSQYQALLAVPEIRAALDTIAWAEGGVSYNTLYGGGTFAGNQHPNRLVTAGGYTSSAAGRYQFLYRTWSNLAARLGLNDFGPVNQDIGAIYLIDERGQLNRLIAGDFEGMMKNLGCLWAALPYSTCNQRQRPLAQTMQYYNAALAVYGRNGGTVISSGTQTTTTASQIGTGIIIAALLLLILD